jgi:FkbM family methyltransferase
MFGETWYAKDYDLPHIPVKKDDVVLDLGANQGFFTCYAALKGARVFAFEPCKESFDTLLANVERNGFSHLVTSRPWAIGAADGCVELRCTDGIGGGMNTTSPAFAAFAKGLGVRVLKTESVQCCTLAAVLKEFALEKIRLCKIDCEGSEFEILSSLDQELLQRIEAFVVEYHPAYPLEDLLKMVLAWGTHQLSFAEDSPVTGQRNILRLVSSRLLASEGAR